MKRRICEATAVVSGAMERLHALAHSDSSIGSDAMGIASLIEAEEGCFITARLLLKVQQEIRDALEAVTLASKN